VDACLVSGSSLYLLSHRAMLCREYDFQLFGPDLQFMSTIRIQHTALKGGAQGGRWTEPTQPLSPPNKKEKRKKPGDLLKFFSV